MARLGLGFAVGPAGRLGFAVARLGWVLRWPGWPAGFCGGPAGRLGFAVARRRPAGF